MTALCGYVNGDLNSPAGCSPGFGCLVMATPGVFGCTDWVSTNIPTTCIEAGEQTASPTTGVITCSAETPYCATISLYYSDLYYTHWECATRANQAVTILASPTITGDAVAVTQYLEAVAADTPSSPDPDPDPDDNDDGGGGRGGGGGGGVSTGVIVMSVIGTVSGAVTAIGTIWRCIRRNRH